MDVGFTDLSQSNSQALKYFNRQAATARLSKRKMKDLSPKIYDSLDDLSWNAALSLAGAVSQQSARGVILATGETPRKMYQFFQELHNHRTLPLDKLSWYHLDDFFGVRDNQYSFSKDIWDNCLSPLGVNRRNYTSWQDILANNTPFHVLDEQFTNRPPDIAILGIGKNGHIGFNEPGSSFFSCSRKMPLTDQTVEMFREIFNGEPPTEAIGMGVATILKAKKIILMASGKAKAEAVAQMLGGPVNPDCPASFLQLHDNVEVFLDKDAASAIDTQPAAPHVVDRVPGKILFCSPHPDDTAISAGGFLYAHRDQAKTINLYSGHRSEIANLSVDQRIALRKAESEEEAAILGIQSEFAALKGYEINYAIDEADVEYLANQIENFSPRHIMVPMLRDPHPAHKACRELVFHTLERLQRTQPLDIWFYETPWGVFHHGEMNTFFAVDDATMAKKLAAIRAHDSQCKRTPYDKAAADLASFRAIVGQEQEFAGFGGESKSLGRYAECFQRFMAT